MKSEKQSMMVFVWVFLLVFTGLTVVRADDLAKGRQLYATCIACHGDKGQGNAPLKAPRLSSLQAWYIEAQLQKFKDGVRGANSKDAEGMMMAPMAKMLATPADMKAVSAYAASLESPNPKPIAGGDAAKGKALYGTCLACHGDKGQGNDALKSPALAGLDDWYIVSQLKKFKDGTRGTHAKDVTGMQMRPMAMMLTDEQAMKDLAAHISSF